MIKFPTTNVDIKYTKFIGGLLQKTPTLTFPPGALFATLNYVPATEGGYRRIDGYERFDGQPAPSEADYDYLEVTFTDTVLVDDTITGVTSTETAIVVLVGSDYLVTTKMSGDFQEEAFTVGGAPKGSITAVYPNGAPTALLGAQAKNAAADEYRSDIAKPSGDNPIRGLGLLDGTLYAFVDNAGGTAGELYKQTTGGWSAISLLDEISFDTGVAEISDGDTITQLVSGATALVKRVILESGSWTGGDATGRLVLDSITGVFTATNDLQVAAATKATATSLTSAITISPGGRYEIIAHNFSGSVDNKRLYGCDGVNRAFEFDGEVYAPIHLPLESATDKPTHIIAHKQQLFLSVIGSSFNSEPGKPFEYTALSGTIEIALGETVSGYMDLPGQALGIFSRNSSYQLSGNNLDDFVLDTISAEVGAIPYSIEKMAYVFVLDDRGIVRVSSTDTYGNFAAGTISRQIQTSVGRMQQVVTASSVYRSDDQYRLYGSDGTGICMTLVGDEYHFSVFEYPDNVACTVSGELSDGSDAVFFGDDSGMVYQADRGSSFDGADIEAFVMLPFNNFDSPTVFKSFRRGVIEMVCDSYSSLQFSTEFSYGDPTIPQSVVNVLNESGPGGLWDVDNWDEIFYDTALINNPSFKLLGTGINMSLVVYSKSDIDLGHKLDGIIVHYTPRRLQR